jgi:hypothetical protein
MTCTVIGFTSSSSATHAASAVCVPVPESCLCTTSFTVPSGKIRTQALGSNSVAGAGFRVAGGATGRQIQSNRQARSDRRRLLEKHPAGRFEQGVVAQPHHASFGAFAARLIALLIRP